MEGNVEFELNGNGPHDWPVLERDAGNRCDNSIESTESTERKGISIASANEYFIDCITTSTFVVDVTQQAGALTHSTIHDC